MSRAVTVNATIKAVTDPIVFVALFDGEVLGALRDLALPRYDVGYLCGRVAPLGAVSSSVATAALGIFHPEAVDDAVSEGWSASTPSLIRSVRDHAAARRLQAIAQGRLDVDSNPSWLGALEAAVNTAPSVGAPIAAGIGELEPTDDPWVRLFRAAERQREHRFSSHLAAAMAAGVEPLPLVILGERRLGFFPPGLMPYLYGWTDAEGDAAAEQLTADGLLGGAGELTDSGRRLTDEIEAATDASQRHLASNLTEADVVAIAAALGPVGPWVFEAGCLPLPTEISNVVTPFPRQLRSGGTRIASE
jgi:hypothetical protein